MSAPGVSIESLDKDQIKTVISIYIPVTITLPIANHDKQFSDFLLSYNKLSELCFADCVTDFTARTIKPTEVCSLVFPLPID